MTDYALSHFIHLCRFIPTLDCIYHILHIDPEVKQASVIPIHIAKCLSISFIDWVPALLSLN